MMDHVRDTTHTFLKSRHAAVYIFLFGFLFATLFSSFAQITPAVSLLILVIALGIYFLEKKVLLFICLLSISLASLRYDIKDFHEIQTPTNTGIVVSEPERRDLDTRFVFESDNGEEVLVSTDVFSLVEYGERVEVQGKFERPKSDSFDYAAYLSVNNIYWTVNYAKIKIVSAPSFSLISTLIKIKTSFVNRIKSILPEPEASLLAGLIVAGKQVLPAGILDDFKRAGVVHIVVLSGYNITIIAEFFLGLLGFLGRKRAAIISALAIIAFTLMTGAAATVVRAAIMVLALLFGRIIGRPYHPGRILLFTAVLMLLWNPKYLVFDPSFQLTFLAMLALIYVMPIVESYLTRVPEKLGFRTTIATTVSTQVTVLPFLMYSVGSVSLVSVFSNILILFFVPYTMLVGFIATLLAYVSTYLAWPLAFVTHILLMYILAVAHFFGNLSFASIQIKEFPLWGTLLLYLIFGITLWRFRNSFHTSASSSS